MTVAEELTVPRNQSDCCDLSCSDLAGECCRTDFQHQYFPRFHIDIDYMMTFMSTLQGCHV